MNHDIKRKESWCFCFYKHHTRKNEKKLLCIVVAVIVIVLAIFTAEYCKSQKILRELESLENGYQEFELEGYKKILLI